MNYYQKIEKMLGREMTDNEFWEAVWAWLNQVAVADVVSAFKARTVVELERGC